MAAESLPADGAGAGAALVNLAHAIDAHPDDAVALIASNRETTYGELRRHASAVRGALAAAGVTSGDRVAIVCGNTRSFVVGYLGVLGIGAVAVPLNPASPAPELAAELTAVTPAAAIVGANTAWDDIEDRAALDSVRFLLGCDGYEPSEAAGASALLDDVLEAFEGAGGSAPEVAIVDVPGDHLAALMFTSGTAGPPRAAMLTHANLLANIDQTLSAPDRSTRDDVVYSVLPLFHIFGLNVVLGVSLTVGATVLLVQRFDPATAVESIAQRRVSVVPGAPPMWVSFAHFDELPADAFATVRLALSGASRLPPAVAERCRERFGLTIREGYGLTEAAPVVTSSSGGAVRVGSVGRVLPGIDVRLVGDDGDDVPAGDAGEVWVRGANVFAGYWNDPEASARVLHDGWLRTGDIATVDHDGYLYLVDRAKDLIIVSGFNVFPAEVEEVLSGHPAVAEVGVVGVPHPHHGEAVKAYVVPRPDHEVDEEQLIAYCADFVARYKCPSKVVFVDELPRNVSGKLLRRHLHDSLTG